MNKSWKFYTIMTVIARESEQQKWKIIFLVTAPSRLADVGANVLLDRLT